ncbi:MAG: NAD(P)H-quinone oxidoreductase [Deltaproteobacteria bacterium]|nr:NAD(P)H-quinone oxidoreductase [Deltaproteobacteria bacterium]
MIAARAVKIREPGGPDVLELTDTTVRDPGVGELRVRVEAVGLNRADLLQRQGLYPAPPGAPTDIPGLEYAGVVDALGPDTPGWSLEEPVFGICGGGAFCTHLVVHHREALRRPMGLDAARAAAIPEAFVTAWDALVLQGGLRAGDTVLVHAVGSGVGTAALQVAKAHGATVLGTTRTRDKLGRCLPLGLDGGVVVTDGTFAEAVLELAPDGVDLVLDLIGGAYLQENVNVLAQRGRILALGLQGGAFGELPLGALLQKRGGILASTLRARPLEEKITLAQRFQRELVPRFVSGALRPVIEDVLPMAEVREAHARMEANGNLGKIVLRW